MSFDLRISAKKNESQINEPSKAFLDKLNAMTQGKTGQWWPAAGAVSGIVAGTVANLAVNLSIYKKGKGIGICETGLPIISKLNSYKQWEIKNYSFVTPAVLAATSLLANIPYKLYYRNEEIVFENEKGGKRKISVMTQLAKEIKNIPYRDILASSVLLYLTMVTKVKLKAQYENHIDPSGHVLVKTAATYAMISAMKYVNRMDQSKLVQLTLTTAGILAAVADFPSLISTGYCFHSVVDVVTGFAAAAGLAIGVDLGVDAVSKVASIVFSSASQMWQKVRGNAADPIKSV